MSILDRLFARRPSEAPPPAASEFASVMAPVTNTSLNTRKELLRVVLRDTLGKHGIPPHWIGADVLVATSRVGQQGLHWRFQVKHWDPRLMLHGVAIEDALKATLLSFDPLATQWLTGMSWQFALADDSDCPALPEPGVWATVPQAGEPASAEAVEVAAAPHSKTAPRHDIPDDTDEDVRASLEALFAARDEDYRRHASAHAATGEHADDATQPMWLSTEPAKL